MEKNYWGYRIDNRHIDFFFNEVKEGRLRQGWGYNSSQNLRNDNIDKSARRNKVIMDKVKKGDYLLVPHVENWDEIIIVEAVEDFDKGYRFDIDKKYGDYGHIFPVKYIKKFSRYNHNVGSNIKETFKCRSRFWNINRCSDEIIKLIKLNQEELVESISYDSAFQKRARDAFDIDNYKEKLYDELNNYTQASEWEHLLCAGLRKIFPEEYIIQTTSNKIENHHGADILITIPGILDRRYVIAIQIKDYEYVISNGAIDQICKADNYFVQESDEKLIDKYLIVTKATKELNRAVLDRAKESDVQVILADKIKDLISQMGLMYIAKMVNDL